MRFLDNMGSVSLGLKSDRMSCGKGTARIIRLMVISRH
jgi:hypothetical protein